MNKNSKVILICVLVVSLIVCIVLIMCNSSDNDDMLGSERQEDIVGDVSDRDNNDTQDYVFEAVKDSIQTEALIYSIDKEELYYTYENEKKQVTTIKGIPVQVIEYIKGGIYCVEVITKDGTVWYCEVFETDNFKKVTSLAKYEITKFVTGKEGDLVYYLTKDGKTINKEGIEYSKANQSFTATYGEEEVLKIKKDNKVYYDKDGKYNYVTVKDKSGNELKAKVIYWQYSSMLNDLTGTERYIIVTDDNKLYCTELKENAVELGNGKQVKSVSYTKGVDEYDVEYIEAVFTMTDDSIIKITDINSKLFDMQSMTIKEIEVKGF